MKSQPRVGTIVTYNSGTEQRQYGKVKEKCEDKNFVFVVFHCNGDWANWKDYTGQRTNIKSLKKGWV